jgi:beta-lactam-binding protein with PASTA domain/tRNA A-37 threonylcarbamoyl transferase component Bud32
MDATLADPLVGHLLDGRYLVESRIARGGMATVYVATDTRLDRTVALKIMHRELATDADFVRRFIGEAKSVARLSHPNVVAVFDQGSDGENLYLAMEYVPGRTLRDLLNERWRLGPAEALDLMVPVLAGLGAAHQAGFVHRDVKPENVLITADGRVKVVDFGLARAVAEARHTKTGMVIGTVAYLAPEQVSRATADARSDVYAAGVMLFELVTGSQPHRADTPLAVAYKHVNETVPAPSSLVPGLPQAVDALVAATTSRDPRLRPEDASQLLRAVFDTRRLLPDGSDFAQGTQLPLAGPPGEPGGPWQQVRPGYLGQPWQQVQPGEPGRHDAAAPDGSGAPSPRPAPMLAPPCDGARPVPTGPPPAPPSAGQAPADGQGQQHSMIFGVPGVPGVAALPTFASGSRHGSSSVFDDAAQVSGYRTEFFRQAERQHNTLIVSRGGGGHGARARQRGSLADWLFSRRAAYLAGGIAVVLVASLVVWWQASGRYTRVPKVTGLATSTAAAELRNLGFKVKMGPPQVDNQVPVGDVARTVPGNGSHALNGGTITLISSAGPRMIPVPNVTGKAVGDARKALVASGLMPGAVQQQTSPTVPQNEVISTDPLAGTSWPQTKPVTLTVSAGIGLPDFTGQPKQVAEQWLQQHQLQVQELAASTSQPLDSVIKQSPAPNTSITQGEVVTLYISTGPPVVQIPAVTGMPVHDARKQLEARGFQVNVVGFGHGRVLVYQPTGQAPKGSTITLVAGPG